jgi:hypothetical protein
MLSARPASAAWRQRVVCLFEGAARRSEGAHGAEAARRLQRTQALRTLRHRRSKRLLAYEERGLMV